MISYVSVAASEQKKFDNALFLFAVCALLFTNACSSRNPDALTNPNLNENAIMMDANAATNVPGSDAEQANGSATSTARSSTGIHAPQEQPAPVKKLQAAPNGIQRDEPSASNTGENEAQAPAEAEPSNTF